ncbi:MAG: efflux RND transporter permease subunit [Pseudomonadota bacterium]|nr:efflux RND transporter permease subunit [Pseudomonadota bacterium]
MKKSFFTLLLDHKTAANLFLILMIILGLYSSKILNTQFFPNYSIDYITINVEWPGASPKDIEESIIKPIEEKVRYIDKVKNTKSSAIDSFANILLEFRAGTNMQRALDDVDRAINSVNNLPEDAKDPDRKVIIPFEQIGLILVSGKVQESQLKFVAKNIKQKLLDKGIDKVDIDGLRKSVIYIDADPTSMFANKLDINDLYNEISSNLKSLPSGVLKDEKVIQLRTNSANDTINKIRKITFNSSTTNQDMKLDDIAAIYEKSKETESFGLSNSNVALTLRVFRSLGTDTLKSTKILEDTVIDFNRTSNQEIKIEIYDLSSQLIRDRINLLLKNGLGGLILVLIILFLFLRFKVAIWVAVGIPAAISATLAIMLITGQSINMISLFALIMMLGIIVDDSIVVAEHIDYQYEKTNNAYEASYQGAAKMLGPVTAASLTTVAGFAPVFLISGVIGQVIEAIPLVVISVILASLFECFFVLPGHLYHALSNSVNKIDYKFLNLNSYLTYFNQRHFYLFLKKSIEFRYTTFSLSIAFLIFSAFLLKFGLVKFYFFPSPESNIILVNYNFFPGNLKKDTVEYSKELEYSLKKIDENRIVKNIYTTIGKPIWGSRDSTKDNGDHIGGMIVELIPSEKRNIRTVNLIEAWKKAIPPKEGLRNLTIKERKGGPPGLDIDIRLMSKKTSLYDMKLASEFIKKRLANYQGVSDIKDNLPVGKREVAFMLTEKGKSLGFDTKYIARKIKENFDGVLVGSFFRGQDEIEVIVRHDQNELNIANLNSFLVKSPEGVFIPLGEVVLISKKQDFSIIKRRNGFREISITAEINENVLNPDYFFSDFKVNTLSQLKENYNLEWKLAGRSEEQADTFQDMKRGGMLALGVIFVILAFIFQSYLLPICIMSIIPFILIGVVLGHWITGFDITILSLVAILGLAGIVVNDSIILVSNIYEKISDNIPVTEAVIKGSQERLRAVLLTSFTTIAGLTPLLFERSEQAQFLKPMAITIVFGLLSSTLIVLIVIPTLITIGTELKDIIFGSKNLAITKQKKQ